MKSFDSQLNTYAIDYDDGDFEPTVPASFLRHAPSYLMQPLPSHNPPPPPAASSAPPVPSEIPKASAGSLKGKLGGKWGALKNAAGLNNNNSGGGSGNSTPAVAAAASAFGKGGVPKLSVAERLARAAEKAKAEKAFQVAAPPPVKSAPKQWVPKNDSSPSSSAMVPPPFSSTKRRASLVPAGPVIVPTRDDEMDKGMGEDNEEEKKEVESGNAALAEGEGGDEPGTTSEGGGATATMKPSKMAGLWKKAGNATQAANRISGGGAFGVQLKKAPSPAPKQDEREVPPVAQPSNPPEKQTEKPSSSGEEPVRNFDLPPELEGVFTEKEVNSFRELFLL